MAPALKTQEIVTPVRVEIAKRSRFSPVRGMEPEKLSRQLDSFECGHLRDFALTAEAIADRDDILKSVIPKRKKGAARHGWKVLTVDDSRAALKQKEKLEAFYNSVTVTDASDLNQRGGMKLLVRQMMDAVAKRYAVHEIVWKPGPQLSAEFRFVPLWFFENTTGKLRYLTADFAQQGVDLDPDGWMVTVADGLMIASSIAWMFKNLPLKDWVTYCERHGMPGIRGVTGAAKDSPQWAAMEEAVKNFAAEFAAVMSDSEKIEVIDLKGGGELPYPALVERMDRALVTIWMGSDLGTMSKGQGVGASVQGDASTLIEEDDTDLITETLNAQVDPVVLRYHFGDAPALAYISIQPPKEKSLEMDLKVDDFLLRSGAPLAISSTLEHYGRPMPDAGEDLLTAPAPPPQQFPGAMANEGDITEQVYQSFASDLQPLRKRLERILQIADPALMAQKLRDLVDELPDIARDLMADPSSGRALADLLSVSFARGATAKKGAS